MEETTKVTKKASEASEKSALPQKPKSSQPFYMILLETAWAHPIFTALFLCVFAMTLTTGKHVTKIGMIMPSLAVFLMGVCAGLHIVRNDIKHKSNAVLVSFILFAASFAGLFAVMVYQADRPGAAVLNFGLAAITGVYIYLGVKNKLTTKNIVLLIAAAGFLIRLAYIMYLSITLHQHDVSSIGTGKGHIGYIEFLCQHNYLPPDDVRNTDQFYHAPLHHIIASMWVKVQYTYGISYESAFENVQLLTLFYSSVCFILSYKIFRKLKLNGKGLIFASAVIAFSPTFIILSASINNDILSVTLMLGAIYNTLRWYEKQTFKNIIPIALCVGFGMMTKLSVWMITPAIAFVFLFVFFGNLKNYKKNLAQFGIFGIICIPLGLYWPLRNLIRDGVPITYVPKLSETSKQYVGNIPMMQRLFDFDLHQFKDVGDQFTMYGGEYNEYNPLVALFKTASFDEGITTKNYPAIAGFNTILFWSMVLIGLAGFIAMVYMLIKNKTELNRCTKIFLALLYAVIFVSYYVFCFEFPHVCTENIRYAVPLIVIGAYFIGLAIQRLLAAHNRIKTAAARVLCTAVIVYAASSTIVYDIVSHKVW